MSPTVSVHSAPDAQEAWRHVADAYPHARLAHAVEWLGVIARAYGHDPLYLSADDGGRCCGLLPAFLVRRPLFGAVVASMPFLDSGGPCASPAAARLLIDRLIAEARRRGARFVELRTAEPLAIDVEPLQHKVNMTLALDRQPDVLWRGFDKTVRNQIRKAERSGLSIETAGAAALPAFYEAFAERMRDLGSPVHGIGFLRAVFDAFGPRARLVLLKKDATLVGGLVAIAFKDRIAVPWAACRKAFFALCPNMLLYWDTIRTACLQGFSRFEFGRSTRKSGTYEFKRQWGAIEEPIYWYRIALSAQSPRPHPSDTQPAATLARMWQRLPLPVTRQLGPRLRKYLIQ